MIRGIGNGVIAVIAAMLVDRYVYAGHYTDVALTMLRQIQHSFGL
jgi:hypothetical protein